MSHNSKLNILQWNCQSAVAKKENLENILYSYQIQVALLSETWFKPGTYIKFSNYDLIRLDRSDGRSGVAILVKSDLNYTQVHQLPSVDNVMYVAAKVAVSNNCNITFVSLYIRPQDYVNKDQCNQLFVSLQRPFIVGGDFNSHHHIWGCDTTDRKGRELLEIIQDNNLSYLNDGSATLLTKPGNNKSAIDLTIASPDILHLLQWQTLDDPNGSDHLPIIIKSYIETKTVQLYSHRIWKTTKADWKQFSLSTESMSSTISNANYSSLVEVINESATISVPKFKNHNVHATDKGTCKPWWNEDCTQAVKARSQAYIKYKNNSNLSNLIQYKKTDANTKKLLKATKRESWKNYCLSLNKNTPIKVIWQKVNKYRNYWRPNGKKVIPPQTLEHISDNLCPSWVPVLFPTIDSHFIHIKHPLTQPFSLKELQRVLKHNETTPGKDNIHHRMLYYLSISGRQLLLNIFNRIWDNQEPIPPDWKEYIIVLLHKPGRDMNSHNSYRPIALASNIMKTYEQLIKVRLEWWLENNDLMPKTQFGFRRSRSTIDSLTSLVTDIQIAFSENKSITAFFADISKAYDSVLLDRLFEKMVTMRIPVKVCYNIVNLYTDRKVFIKGERTLLPSRVLNMGLPQGSCLSPTLYIIYSKDLEITLPAHTKLLQFADDICVYVKGNKVDMCHNLMEESIISLRKWTDRNGLEISESKSHICTFTRSRYNPPTDIYFAEKRFPYRNVVKFLGVILDKKLNWKDHIHSIAIRAEKIVNLLKAFSRRKWGADPNVLLHMYRTLIRPIFDYGNVLYTTAADCHLRRLDVIQNQCLRLCVGFLKSTPTEVLHAETTEWPLSFRRKFLSDNYLATLYSKKSKIFDAVSVLTVQGYTSKYWRNKKLPMLIQSFSDHSSILNKIYSSEKLPYFKTSLLSFMNTIKIKETDYQNIHENIRNQVFEWDLDNKWPGYVHIFTDGSKSVGVGCAYYCPKTEVYRQYKLPGITSIFTAELFAIEKAMAYCEELEFEKFVIFSDSKSSLESLKLKNTKIHKANNIVCKIVEIHTALKENNKEIQLVWLKGHANIEKNEVADRLAKEAAVNGEVSTEFKVPGGDLRAYFKHLARQQWQQEFDISPKGQFYKDIQPILPTIPWFSREINYNFIQTISRLRSNHALYPAHMFRIQMKVSPLCEICEEVGDMQHIALECVLNWDKIEIFIENLVNSKVELPTNWKHLLALNRINVYKIIFQHVKLLCRL